MSSLQTLWKRPRIIRYLLLLGTIVAVVAIAQTSSDQGNHKILIDGSKNPDQIPDWLLWNELFRIAATQDNKLLSKGKEFWIDKLHLAPKAMDELIKHGHENSAVQAAAKKEADDIVSASKGESKDRIRVKLRKPRLYAESRTLELRDKLRARIDEDSFQRLQSFARSNLATGIKMGN